MMNQAIIFPIVFLFSILKHDFTLSDISNIASSFQSRLINLHFPSYTYGYSRRETKLPSSLSYLAFGRVLR